MCVCVCVCVFLSLHLRVSVFIWLTLIRAYITPVLRNRKCNIRETSCVSHRVAVAASPTPGDNCAGGVSGPASGVPAFCRPRGSALSARITSSLPRRCSRSAVYALAHAVGKHNPAWHHPRTGGISPTGAVTSHPAWGLTAQRLHWCCTTQRMSAPSVPRCRSGEG